MGQRMKIWATMTSIILLSGMLGLGFSPDAFAKHDPNSTGNGFAKGCDNKNDNGNKENNPHCEDVPDPPAFNICDTDMDGKLSSDEIKAFTGKSDGDMIILMLSADADSSGFIDTEAELASLNTSIEPDCI